MQDRFAGDFGDYVKLALLKHLREGRRLNVCWFRTPDLITGNDGRHTEYLRPEAAARWRPFDPATYDQLRSMVESGQRSIQQLTFALAAPGVEFFDFELSTKANRSVWFAELSAWAGQADLLFLDPDNGVAAAGSTGGTASVTQQEVTHLLRSAATLIVYHHQTPPREVIYRSWKTLRSGSCLPIITGPFARCEHQGGRRARSLSFRLIKTLGPERRRSPKSGARTSPFTR